MDNAPELITFIEVDSQAISNLTEGVEHIGTLHYPYEHHLTLGRLTDECHEGLRQFGEATVDYTQAQIHKHTTGFAFEIVVDLACRQPVMLGGGFYLRPTESCMPPLLQIHKELMAFGQENRIRASELISDYCPHVSLTIPLAQSLVNQHQEQLILKAINDKITSKPSGIILRPLAIRTILKYHDEQGHVQRETWEIPLTETPNIF